MLAPLRRSMLRGGTGPLCGLGILFCERRQSRNAIPQRDAVIPPASAGNTFSVWHSGIYVRMLTGVHSSNRCVAARPKQRSKTKRLD